jgi:N-acyl-D-aspartate/D-glutamate deacylase
MEGVEEIPNPVLAAGLNWEWESFPQFMDELDRRERAIDIAAQIAHLPLRVYVMGDRAIRREPASADDIAEMRRLTIEALNVGAFGFTTSRTDSHKTPDGELVPSRDADADELLGIGSALGVTGTGAFGMNSDFDNEDYELAWMTKLARETGRPIWFLLTDRYEDPQRWRRLIRAVHAARAKGLSLTAQIAGRPIGVMMGIGTALNPFTVRPSYKQIESLPIEEQRRRLRDPEMRRRILAEKPSDAEVAKLAQFRQLITSRFDLFFTMGNPPDYEPGPEKSVAAIAAREGRTTDEVAYDYILEDGHYLYFPVVNYVHGDHETIREMLNDPACLLGLSDGGAHCTSIVDAGVPSYMLMHWGRDRARGPRLPLEHLVKRQTSETANFFGLTDRGRLAPGLRADVNVIDFEGLMMQKPEIVHDMPASGRRFIQRVTGYEATLVAGQPIFERGEHTGALPGRLVRAAREGASVAA